MSGSRGPLPKPVALRLLEGNAGKRALNLADGINPDIVIPSIPKHLGIEAKKEWKRITPILFDLGLITGLDRTALALYCQSSGRLFELETAFNGMVQKHVDAGKSYADAVFEASYTATPSGYQQQSVIVQLISQHRLQVHRHLSHFGLSPSQRGRVTASNYVQPELPGVVPAPNVRSGFAQFAIVGGG